MTREYMLSVLRDCLAEGDDGGELASRLNVAIGWLESIPSCISLAGINCSTWQSWGVPFAQDATIDIEFKSWPTKV